MQARPDARGNAGETGAAAASPRSRPLLHYKDLGLVTQNRKIRFTCVHASENFLACGYGLKLVDTWTPSDLFRI